MSASITTGKKENNSSARGHPDNFWTVMNRSLLEARKFCKLFPKRKVNEFQAENDSRHVESKPEPYSKTSQPVPGRGTIYTNGCQPACVCVHVSENSDFAQIQAGPASKLPPTLPSPPLRSCPLMLSKPVISTGHSAGRSHSGSQGPLGAHTLHCLSLGRPSAPCLCLRGLACRPAGLLLCESLLRVPGDPSSLGAGQEPHCPFHLCSECLGVPSDGGNTDQPLTS